MVSSHPLTPATGSCTKLPTTLAPGFPQFHPVDSNMSKTVRRSNAATLLLQVVSSAVLNSALAVTCARAEDVLPGTAYAMAVVFSRNVADEATATGEKTSNVASPAEDHVAPNVQTWIMRQIISHKAEPVNLAALGNEAAADARPNPAADTAPAAEAPAAGALMPEKSRADPNFDRWQRDADEKLKHEADLTKRRENPLALAHPDSFVVACEAGCRDPKDHIIYMVLKTAASTRRLDVASSLDAQASTPLQNVPAPAVEDEGSVPCVAGCYDGEQPKKRQLANNAEARDPVRPGAVMASLATTSTSPEPASQEARSYQTHGSIRNPELISPPAKRQGSLALRARRLTHKLAQHSKTERPQRPRFPARHFEKITLMGIPARKISHVTKVAYRFHR